MTEAEWTDFKKEFRDEIKNIRADIKHDSHITKEEMRKVSDNLIRLEVRFDLKNKADQAWQDREANYYKEFLRHQEKYRKDYELVTSNTAFRTTATKHIWFFWTAIVGGLITAAYKFMMFK